jgi:hypothetical protein
MFDSNVVFIMCSNVFQCVTFQIHKIIGFAPSLLQVVMLSDVDMPVRQAGELNCGSFCHKKCRGGNK